MPSCQTLPLSKLPLLHCFWYILNVFFFLFLHFYSFYHLHPSRHAVDTLKVSVSSHNLIIIFWVFFLQIQCLTKNLLTLDWISLMYFVVVVAFIIIIFDSPVFWNGIVGNTKMDLHVLLAFNINWNPRVCTSSLCNPFCTVCSRWEGSFFIPPCPSL